MASVTSDRRPARAADALAAVSALGLCGLGLYASLPRRSGVLAIEAFAAHHDFARAALLTVDRAPVFLALLAVLLLAALAARIRWLRRPTAVAWGVEALAWSTFVALLAGLALAVPAFDEPTWPDTQEILTAEQVFAHVHAGMTLTLALVAAAAVLLLRAVATVALLRRRGPALRAIVPALAALGALWIVLSPWFLRT